VTSPMLSTEGNLLKRPAVVVSICVCYKGKGICSLLLVCLGFLKIEKFIKNISCVIKCCSINILNL